MGKTRAEAIKAEGRARWYRYSISTGMRISRVFPRAESAEAIIHDPGLGVVFICTPNWLNQPLTIAALNRENMFFAKNPRLLMHLKSWRSGNERATQKKTHVWF